MVLILCQYHQYLFALNMNHVSKIFEIDKIKPDKKLYILNPDTAKIGILLKNSFIFPSEKVNIVLKTDQDIHKPDLFFKGFIKKQIFDGFVLEKDKIYGILNKKFLDKKE